MFIWPGSSLHHYLQVFGPETLFPLSSHVTVIQRSPSQHRDSHSISLSGVSEHCCNTQKNNISRNNIKTHIVYSSSSAILPTRALLPPPNPHPNIQHLARKKKSCTAVDKNKLKKSNKPIFSPVTQRIYVFYFGCYVRGGIQEVPGHLVP